MATARISSKQHKTYILFLSVSAPAWMYLEETLSYLGPVVLRTNSTAFWQAVLVMTLLVSFMRCVIMHNNLVLACAVALMHMIAGVKRK